MVSVYPNPPPDQDFSNFYGFHMGGDPMKLPGVNRNDSNLLTAAGNVASGVDDPNKKIRKPYTITKSRESWSEQEHDKFLEALHLFDRDWKKIEAFVGSKTVIQIRSHAQKYFLKVQKNGTSEHVPPPRPKRKAAHPYPQKAPKSVASPATGTSQSLATVPETGYALGADPLLVCRNQMAGSPSPWTYNVATTGPSAHIQKDIEFANAATNYSSSNESTPRMWTSNEAKRGLKQQSNCARVIPDFAQVYRFIGSVFDPSARNHLQRLKEMDPINIETAVMLMKNLSINLVSPEFEDHQKLLTSYNSGGIENNSSRGSAITSV